MMQGHPGVQGFDEVEEDLIREQNEFLNAQSRPAATAVRVRPRNPAPTPGPQRPAQEAAPKQPLPLAERAPREPMAAIIGDIVEKSPDSGNFPPPSAPTAPLGAPKGGFPSSAHRAKFSKGLGRGPRAARATPLFAKGGAARLGASVGEAAPRP